MARGLPTYALLTTAPNELCASVHDRMPAIVRQADYARRIASQHGMIATGPASGI